MTIHSSSAEYLTYIAATGDTSESFEMRYEDENIWLTQKMVATLYDMDVRTINNHIQKKFWWRIDTRVNYPKILDSLIRRLRRFLVMLINLEILMIINQNRNGKKN